MKQTLELARRRCGAPSNAQTGQHLTDREVDSVCLGLLALHSALLQAKRDVEAVPHAFSCASLLGQRPHIGPLGDPRPCNCWKSRSLTGINAALEGK